MLHYLHHNYWIMIDPIPLPDHKQWQVRFFIARHSFPTPKTGKIFIFPETFDSETKAINRSVELGKAAIEGNLPGERKDL
jgi:hypothetical protein